MSKQLVVDSKTIEPGISTANSPTIAKPQLDLVNGVEVMKSTDLHKVVFGNTGKFKRLSDFNDKIRKTLINQDGGNMPHTIYKSNGTVDYYNLTEVECNMVMAKVDINHLRLISEVFVKVEQQLSVPVDSDQVLLAHIELEKLKITEKTKQLEIEAKVKLGRKKTGIKRKPTCPRGYTHMKAYERYCEDSNQPMPMSLLKAILEAYSTEIDTRDNCFNEGQFDEAVSRVCNRFKDDGAYWKDPLTKVRTLKTKLDWL